MATPLLTTSLLTTSLLTTSLLAPSLPRTPPVRRAAPPVGLLSVGSGEGGWGRMEGVETTTRCFMDIEVGGVDAGRLEFNLFGAVAPLTVENFRCLCTGEKGVGSLGKPLHYKGVPFHRIVGGGFCQGGDIVNGDGSGGESIYGVRMDDENFELAHTLPGLLSMANSGPNTSNSQFSIITFPRPADDRRHVVFGELASGWSTLTLMEATHDPASGLVGATTQPVIIAACGELPLEPSA